MLDFESKPAQKTCYDCGKDKPINSFGKNDHGIFKSCKNCVGKKLSRTCKEKRQERILNPYSSGNWGDSVDQKKSEKIPTTIQKWFDAKNNRKEYVTSKEWIGASIIIDGESKKIIGKILKQKRGESG